MTYLLDSRMLRMQAPKHSAHLVVRSSASSTHSCVRSIAYYTYYLFSTSRLMHLLLVVPTYSHVSLQTQLNHSELCPLSQLFATLVHRPLSFTHQSSTDAEHQRFQSIYCTQLNARQYTLTQIHFFTARPVTRATFSANISPCEALDSMSASMSFVPIGTITTSPRSTHSDT